MKAFLLVLLTVSLAANALLGLYLVRSSGPASERGEVGTPIGDRHARAATLATPSAPIAAAKPPATIADQTWASLGGDGDLTALVANLRRAGFPDKLIRRMVNVILSRKFADLQLALLKEYTATYWKNTNLGLYSAVNRVSEENRKLVDSLLGPEAETSETRQRNERQYGKIPSEKIAKVRKIASDYDEMVAKLFSSGGIQNESPEMEQYKLLETERQVDIAAALTPEEFTEYSMHNSTSASQLRADLRDVDVTEDEYRKAFLARQEFDRQFSLVSISSDPENNIGRNTAAIKMDEQVRAALGDERFYQYLKRADYNFSMITKATASFGVTSETAWSVEKLQLETAAAALAVTKDTTLSAAARTQSLNALTAAAEQKVTALLGAEATAAYKKQGGSWLAPIATKATTAVKSGQ